MLTSGVIDVHGKFDGLGRFADPSLLILTSLADGPRSGYAIKTDVAGFSGASMAPGTLYGVCVPRIASTALTSRVARLALRPR